MVIATALLLSAFDGAFAAPLWYLAALLLVGVLALACMRGSSAGGWGGRRGRVALALYAAFCVWSYLSITWADAPAEALDGANRTLLYGLVLAIVAARPRSSASCSALVGALGLGVAAIAAGVVVAAAVSPDPRWLLVQGALAAPTGYANATANLWLIGFWPVVHVATSERWPWALRGIATGAACLMLPLTILTQSRGAVAVFAATAAIYFLTGRRRLPAVAVIGCALVAVAAGWGALTAVEGATSPREFSVAVSTITTTALAGLLAGSVAALYGGHLRGLLPTFRLGLPARHAAAVVVIVGALAGAVGLDYGRAGQGDSRLTGSLSSNRSDFYRVAADELRREPVTGIGLGSFMGRYLVHRRTDEAPRFSHSIVASVGSELGLVGAGLLGLSLASAALSIARTRVRAEARGASGLAAAIAGMSAWLLHSIGDYLWEVPALGALAFCLLGVALSRGGRTKDSEGRHERPARWRLRALGVSSIAAPVAAILALAGGASALTESGYAVAATTPRQALARFERAAALNPLSAEPLLAKAIVARDAGDAEQAEDALMRAVEREPRDWLIHFELALLASEARREAEATREFAAAAALNPRLDLTRRLRLRSRAGRRIDVEAAEDPLTYFPARGNSPVLERLAEEREHDTAWPRASTVPGRILG